MLSQVKNFQYENDYCNGMPGNLFYEKKTSTNVNSPTWLSAGYVCISCVCAMHTVHVEESKWKRQITSGGGSSSSYKNTINIIVLQHRLKQKILISLYAYITTNICKQRTVYARMNECRDGILLDWTQENELRTNNWEIARGLTLRFDVWIINARNPYEKKCTKIMNISWCFFTSFLLVPCARQRLPFEFGTIFSTLRSPFRITWFGKLYMAEKKHSFLLRSTKILGNDDRL